MHPRTPLSSAAVASLLLGGGWFVGMLVVACGFLLGLPALEDNCALLLVVAIVAPAVVGCLAGIALGRMRTEPAPRGRSLARMGVQLALLSSTALLLWPAASSFGQKADHQANDKRVKSICIAMHAYHADHGHFPPPGSTGPAGERLLSWRVHLLPHLGRANLYQEFHLDEPWDSPHNIAFLSRTPSVYEHPIRRYRSTGMTHYQVFVGGGAVFEWGGKPRTAWELAVADGTSSTIVMADALEAVPWTKPVDLEYNPAKPLPAFHILKGQILVGFAECSVRRIPAPDTPVREWHIRQLIHWNDSGRDVRMLYP